MATTTATPTAAPTAPATATTEITTREVRHRRPRDWQKYLLWLVLGLGAILMIGPFYWMIITAFKTQGEALAFPPTWWPQNPTLENWIALTDLDFGSFPLFFRNSLFVVTAITLITLLTSAAAGYVFAKIEFHGRDALFFVVLGMLMVPFTVSIVPLFSLMVTLGWTNNYLALIIPIIFNPFGIFLLRQFMLGVPDELIAATRIDGGSEFRIFWSVALPLSKAALAALAIFVFIEQWDNFLWPLIIIDDPNLFTIPLGLAQFRGRFGVEIGSTAAGSIVAVLPVLVVYLFAQKQFIEGIAMTGLKG